MAIKKRPRKPKPQRHQWIDQGLVPRGQPLVGLVRAILQSLDTHDVVSRERARKADDKLQYLKMVNVVVSNLDHAVLVPPQPTGRIAIRLGNLRNGRTRYGGPVSGKMVRRLIGVMDELGFLEYRYAAAQRGEVTSMTPSPWFAGKVYEAGVSLGDFGRDADEELIILTRNTRSRLRDDGTSPTRPDRELIDYEETRRTKSMRSTVRRLNDFLAAVDIKFIDDGLEPVDVSDRILRRRFIILDGQDERFDQGGRLFYGFWQTLKRMRRRNIRVNGEATVELDYGSMFTRLAYAELNSAPPDGDLYAIPGMSHYRSGVKLAMNCFLFDQGKRRSWPTGMGIGVGNDDDAIADSNGPAAQYEGLLPHGWTVARTKKAILSVHPVLEGAWGRGLGYRLMWKESELLLAVLQELASKNVPALGLHDGILVARSHAEQSNMVMSECALRMTGLTIPVGLK